jgi:ribulose-5-phosphate 4-epimerase/fuculose-1-phosphate aldolase
MPIHLSSDSVVSPDPVAQVKIDLAAAHRLATIHELEEGIDNHFTVAVPGKKDRFVILPFGLHWSEARASDMIVFDGSGNTLDGEGFAELTAQCIHVPIHRIAGAQVVLHTHQTWALALNMLSNNRLIPASQTAAYFDGHVSYDDNYSGSADTLDEGERLAHLLKGKNTLFMKNHGVVVIGNSVAQAYHQLYMLERVCRNQILAMSTGQALERIPDHDIAQLQQPPEDERHGAGDGSIDLFFSAMKRILDRQLPGYAD